MVDNSSEFTFLDFLFVLSQLTHNVGQGFFTFILSSFVLADALLCVRVANNGVSSLSVVAGNGQASG
jgi:hypothetical protein